MTPRERSERAKLLLDDPLLMQVFADVRASLVDRLEATAVGDVEAQHEIALMLQLLRRVKTQLEQYIQDMRVVEATERQHEWLIKARQRIGI